MFYKNLIVPKFGVNGELSQGRRREIVNGVVVDPSDAKFFVKTGRDDDKTTPDYVCGGILVHSDIILTAAHCQGAFNYGVLLYDPKTNDYTREATVDLQIRYPDFNGIDTHNDILLLRLSTDSNLPVLEMNSNNSTPTDDAELKAYGFGKTKSTGGASNRLREAQMRYIDNEECSKRVRGTANSIIWDDVLCADPYYDIGGRIEEGGSICQGDSGGPLLDSSNRLVGVTSWNFFCSSDHLPDGFARVAYFHDWITQQICFISRNPTSSNNECPNGTSSPPPAPGSVKVLLNFNHDFYPEETTFRIISKDRDGQVEYAGPKYVPGRESSWTSGIYLVPGAYTLEIFDIASNGLSPNDRDKKGSWSLAALYEDKIFETKLASGGANFLQKDLVDFVVDDIETQRPTQKPTQKPSQKPTQIPTQIPTKIPTKIPTQSPTQIPTQIPTKSPTKNPTKSPTKIATRNPTPSPTQSRETQSPESENISNEPSQECLSKKFIEEISLGSSSEVVCNCIQNEFSSVWVLSCYDTKVNSTCVANRDTCGAETSLICCGNRRCSNGICRTVYQGSYGRREPLLVSDYRGSSSRLRGTHGGD